MINTLSYNLLNLIVKRKVKVALYQPEIARNVGTIIRNCACLSVELILIEPLGFFMDDRELKRCKMDYSAPVTLIKSYEDFFKQYQEERIILFTPHTSNSMYDFTFKEGDILLFGRESDGVEPEIAAYSNAMVSIPMNPHIRSFNLAVSVGIGLGHAVC